jgi:flagellar biosynthesis protein FlhA
MPQAPRLAGHAGLNAAVPAAIMAVVLMMVLPVPPLLLDLLISCNITLSVVTVIATMYIERPVELSVYPSLLLLLTLLRLALNVSSTRLILMNGHTGPGAAGDVIEAFGDFVVGGNFVVGIVIFVLLIAIQYVVINHGAVRISEVTARFTLDALPGKQMAIDADLNAGLIDEGEARRRREAVSREAEFYGAMDGAVRFTQRDAVASIIITCVNILAGFLIGAISHGIPIEQALETYTVLTVGDGLVTVIPALLISVSGGIITTRAAGESSLGVDFGRQLFGRPEPLMLAAGVMGSLAAVPGLPAAPFLLLGGGAATAGWQLRKKDKALSSAVTQLVPAKQPENVESLLRIEPLAIEVGLGLVKIVDSSQGGALLTRIAGVRRQLAQELGFVLPPVRVTDNLQLKPREYVVLLKGVEIARFELHADSVLAIKAGHANGVLDGVPCKEPAFGLDGLWVPQTQSDKARLLGYTVVDSANVVATHLTELIRRHSHELFTRQDADGLLQRIKDENPKLIEDLVPQMMSLSIVQKVLQNLLRERVSIRDAVSILEALSEAGSATKNATLLTEYVRQALGRSLVQPYLDDKGDLRAYLLGSSLEALLQAGVEHSEQGSRLSMDPAALGEAARQIKKAVGELHGPAALVCSSSVRFAVRQLLESDMPLLAAISHAEIPASARVVSLGTIG